MTVIEEIAAERARQVSQEGWSPDHDDTHSGGELAAAAATYVLGATFPRRRVSFFERHWPWDRLWWKPKDQRRDLVRAAALIVAEIERLDRAAARAKPHA